MRRRVQTTCLAVLAVLLLGTGIVSAHGTASPYSRPTVNLPRISTQLQPGWNMIGWVGPDTPSRRLFQQLPELERISAWDAEQERYWRAWRGEYEQLQTLTAGMGLWLLIGGDASVQWDRPIALEGAEIRLRRGLNLVGWTGDDGTPVRRPCRGLGTRRSRRGAGTRLDSSTCATACARADGRRRGPVFAGATRL